MIRTQEQGNVSVLHMEHGKANAFDREFLTDIQEALSSQRQSASRAIVITGREGIFSAGVDLFKILEGKSEYIRPFIHELDRMLEQLFLFPKPVVAAVNGHAIAGGCILALACDYRIMTGESGTIGVPELLVGVPFPPLPMEIVRFAVAPQPMQELIFTGRNYDPQTALRKGVVDELATPDRLLPRAVEIAEHVGRIPLESYKLVKERLRSGVIEKAKSSSAAEIHQLWNSSEIHATIRAYLDRTIKKK